jgi:PPM family protein phosphatase
MSSRADTPREAAADGTAGTPRVRAASTTTTSTETTTTTKTTAAVRLDMAQAQSVGRRDSQQDAFGFSGVADRAFVAHSGQLAVLADGMGGMRNGLWAASHAVQALVDSYHTKTVEESADAALLRALRAANAVVHEEADRLGTVGRMGTTVVAAVLRGTELRWLNVGDSRLYVFEDGVLRRLSTDHSYAAFLEHQVRRGDLSAGEAMAHPLRHALTSYLGRPEPIEHAGSSQALSLRPGTWVLLCSDGLTQALDDAGIAACLHGDAQSAADRLLQAVQDGERPDQDNTTVVVLHLAEAATALEADSTDAAGPAEALPSPNGGNAAPAVGRARRAPWQAPWREPLWWAGALASVVALTMLWMAVTPAPSPPRATVRPGPSIDLLATPLATPPAAMPAPGAGEALPVASDDAASPTGR